MQEARALGAAHHDISDTGGEIRHFLARKFANTGKNEHPISLADLTDRVLEVAQGNFLVAEVAAQWVLDQRGAGITWTPGDMPADLAGYYLHALNRSVRIDPLDWAKLAAPVLGLLTVGRRPLSVEELATFCGLDSSAVRAVVILYRAFLVPVSATSDRPERWRFFHATFVDFLQSEVQSKHYALHPADQHARLSRLIAACGAEMAWEAAQPYLVENAIPHTIEAHGAQAPAPLDALLSPAYLGLHFATGRSDFSLLLDLRRAIVLAAEQRDLTRAVHWSVIRTLMVQSQSETAHSDALTVRAACGQAEQATALLVAQSLREDPAEAGRLDASSPENYFADLARMTDLTPLSHTLAGLPEDLRARVLWSVINSRAIKDPRGAADLWESFGTDAAWPYQAGERTLTALAGDPHTLHLAQRLASSTGSDVAALARGRAVFDLDGALASIEGIRGFHQDYGGERLYLEQSAVFFQVLTAHVRANPQAASDVAALWWGAVKGGRRFVLHCVCDRDRAGGALSGCRSL